MLVARIGAQRGEVRAGVNGGKIAVAFLECFLEFGERFFLLPPAGVNGAGRNSVDCRLPMILRN
jgi:hypothetical protein